MEKTIAEEIFLRYSIKSGAEQCASLFSIKSLEFLIIKNSFYNILELGGGLGTLTELMLRVSESDLTTVENNPFCINEIEKNLYNQRPYKLLRDYSQINRFDFELLVIDVNNGIFNISELVKRSTNCRAIFIEGHHLAHRINISREVFRKRQIQKLEDWRPARGKKGCAVFFLEVDNSVWHSKAFLSYLKTYTILIINLFVIKIRSIISKWFNKHESHRSIKFLRSIWFGKIPWNF
jgi:hypothetical protein